VKNPDLELLENTLRNSGERARLGDLRRLAGLDPSAVLRLVRDYPDRFCETENETAAPEIVLGTRLPESDCVFIRAVRIAGGTGIAALRLWQKKNIPAKEALELAARYPELVRVEKRDKRIFYFWRAAALSSPPLPSQLAGEALIPETPPAIEPSDGKADDPIPAGPETNSDPMHQNKAGELSLAALPASEVFTDAEYQELKFRPASRGMHSRRHAKALRGDRIRERQEPLALSAINKQQPQPMTLEDTRSKLLEICADAPIHGRHLFWLCNLEGLDRHAIDEVLKAYPDDFILEAIKESSETQAGRVTRERITGYILRVSPRLLTATKQLQVTDQSGTYEVEVPALP
jgi:hypothetical protein